MLLLLFSRFRVIVAALSIAIFLLVFNTAYLCYHSTSAAWLVDISFWLLSIGSIVAGLLDLSLFWRKTPLLSTLLLTIAGTGIVLFARISSTIYSLIETSFYTQPIGGSIVDNTSYRLVSISIFGSFMVLASTAISITSFHGIPSKVEAKGEAFIRVMGSLVRVPAEIRG